MRRKNVTKSGLPCINTDIVNKVFFREIWTGKKKASSLFTSDSINIYNNLKRYFTTNSLNSETNQVTFYKTKAYKIEKCVCEEV